MVRRTEEAEAVITSQRKLIDDLRRENTFLRAKIEDEKAETIAAKEEAKHFLNSLPNCNSCSLKNVCKYAPKHGGSVRYNCFLWEE